MATLIGAKSTAKLALDLLVRLKKYGTRWVKLDCTDPEEKRLLRSIVSCWIDIGAIEEDEDGCCRLTKKGAILADKKLPF